MKGIIKNSKSVYRNANLSLEDRFLISEEKSDKWIDDLIYAQHKCGIIGYFQRLKLTAFVKLDFFWFDVECLIDSFTLKDTSQKEIEKRIRRLREKYPFRLKNIEIRENGNQLVFKLRGEKDVKATKLSYLIPEIKERFPHIESPKRKGNCHWYSIHTATSYNGISVVTGEIWLYGNKAKYLHSWIEQEEDGITLCSDATRNLVMRKEAYYRMFHVKPLEKIKAEQIREDFPLMEPLITQNSCYTKLWLSSRDEAIEIAKKLEKEGKLKRDEKEKN